MNELHKPVRYQKSPRLWVTRIKETYLTDRRCVGHVGKVFFWRLRRIIKIPSWEIEMRMLRISFERSILLDESKLLFYKWTFMRATLTSVNFDIILVDFGVSSPQLDTLDRGFHSKMTGPRGAHVNLSISWNVINHLEKTAEILLQEYGEESIGLAKNTGEGEL